MNKPRLTEPVMRGLLSMAAHFSAEDLRGMEDSGSIDSASDVTRAIEWAWDMSAYRQSKKGGAP